MNLQKIQWKLYFDPSRKPDPASFFRMFNAWIPNSPEVFVDVADYRHVHDGPWTLLVGHYADYALDQTDQRLGFYYSCKKPMEGGNQQKLKASLADFLKTCQRVQKDPLLEGKLKFLTNEFLFLVNDRAIAPNTSQTFAAVKPELENFFGSLVGKPGFTLEHINNPEQRFSVNVHLKTAHTLEELSKKL